MKPLLIPALFMLGSASLVHGVWMIYKPGGFIAAGVLLMTVAIGLVYSK